jgi:hypothetical protein
MLMRWIVTVAVVTAAPPAGLAQYEEQRSYEPSSARYLASGVFFRDFAPREGNTAPDSLVIRYTCVMPILTFNQGPVEVTVGYSTYDLPARSSRAAIFLGTRFTSEFPLAGGRGSALLLPFLLAADYTKSEGAGAQRDDFNVASLGIGTGLKYRLGGEDVDFSATAAAVIHYSFQGYSVQNGSSAALLGDAVLIFRRVPILEGIVTGYRFRSQSWSLGGYFDYRTVNHGVYVGVMF